MSLTYNRRITKSLIYTTETNMPDDFLTTHFNETRQPDVVIMRKQNFVWEGQLNFSLKNEDTVRKNLRNRKASPFWKINSIWYKISLEKKGTFTPPEWRGRQETPAVYVTKPFASSLTTSSPCIYFALMWVLFYTTYSLSQWQLFSSLKFHLFLSSSMHMKGEKMIYNCAISIIW